MFFVNSARVVYVLTRCGWILTRSHARTLQQLVSSSNGGTFIIFTRSTTFRGRARAASHEERDCGRDLSRHRGECYDIAHVIFPPRVKSEMTRSLECNRRTLTRFDPDSVRRRSSVPLFDANKTLSRISRSDFFIAFFAKVYGSFYKRFLKERSNFINIFSQDFSNRDTIFSGFHLEEFQTRGLKYEPWEPAVWIVLKQIGDVKLAPTSARRSLGVCLKSRLFLRARNLITKRRRCEFQGLCESTHSRRESYVMQIFYLCDPEARRCAASKCLLKRRVLVLFLPFLCSSVTSVKNRKLRRKGVGGQRSSGARARKTSLPIKLPFHTCRSTFLSCRDINLSSPPGTLCARERLYLFNCDSSVSRGNKRRSIARNRMYMYTYLKFFPSRLTTLFELGEKKAFNLYINVSSRKIHY